MIDRDYCLVHDSPEEPIAGRCQAWLWDDRVPRGEACELVPDPGPQEPT